MQPHKQSSLPNQSNKSTNPPTENSAPAPDNIWIEQTLTRVRTCTFTTDHWKYTVTTKDLVLNKAKYSLYPYAVISWTDSSPYSTVTTTELKSLNDYLVTEDSPKPLFILSEARKSAIQVKYYTVDFRNKLVPELSYTY